MDTILLLLGMCVVSFIVIRLWVGFWDLIVSGLKRMVGIKPKKVNWHTLDSDKVQSINKEDLKAKENMFSTREE